MTAWLVHAAGRAGALCLKSGRLVEGHQEVPDARVPLVVPAVPAWKPQGRTQPVGTGRALRAKSLGGALGGPRWSWLPKTVIQP